MAVSRKIEQSEYFENEQLISFQTGTRFCERVKRIFLKSPSRIIKVVRLLSYKGSDKILDLLNVEIYIYTQYLKSSLNTISGCVDPLSPWCPLSRGAKSRAGRKHDATLHPEHLVKSWCFFELFFDTTPNFHAPALSHNWIEFVLTNSSSCRQEIFSNSFWIWSYHLKFSRIFVMLNLYFSSTQRWGTWRCSRWTRWSARPCPTRSCSNSPPVSSSPQQPQQLQQQPPQPELPQQRSRQEGRHRHQEVTVWNAVLPS